MKADENPPAGASPDEFDDTQTCRVCGCTDNEPCPGGCYWVEDDLCSRCADEMAERLRNEFRVEHPDLAPILPGENEPPGIMQYITWLEMQVRQLRDLLDDADTYLTTAEVRATHRYQQLQDELARAERRASELESDFYQQQQRYEIEIRRLRRGGSW